MSSDAATDRSLAQRALPYALTFVAATAMLVGVWLLNGRPDFAAMHAAKAALHHPDNRWALSESFLLFALPLGATIVVFVRSILGWKTFGLFTPMLLAMAYLQSGPVLGPLISIVAILIGMACVPLLKWLELSRVAFLGVLIAVVVACLGALARQTDEFLLASAFPVVVTALIVERWWSSWEVNGPAASLKETLMTLFISMIIQFVIAAPMLVAIGQTQPLSIPIASALLMILFGRYKGLRLSEVARFRLARS